MRGLGRGGCGGVVNSALSTRGGVMAVKKPRGRPSAVSSSSGGVSMRVASWEDKHVFNMSSDGTHSGREVIVNRLGAI